MKKANLQDRIEAVRTLRNLQNADIKGYKNEIAHLDKEVANIKQISDALPKDCFKRTRLEP